MKRRQAKKIVKNVTPFQTSYTHYYRMAYPVATQNDAYSTLGVDAKASTKKQYHAVILDDAWHTPGERADWPIKRVQFPELYENASNPPPMAEPIVPKLIEDMRKSQEAYMLAHPNPLLTPGMSKIMAEDASTVLQMALDRGTFEGMTLGALRGWAKDAKIEGSSKMKKADLIDAICEQRNQLGARVSGANPEEG